MAGHEEINSTTAVGYQISAVSKAGMMEVRGECEAERKRVVAERKTRVPGFPFLVFVSACEVKERKGGV